MFSPRRRTRATIIRKTGLSLEGAQGRKLLISLDVPKEGYSFLRACPREDVSFALLN